MLGILGPYRSTNSAYSLHLNVENGTLGDKKCWPKWTEVCLEQGLNIPLNHTSICLLQAVRRHIVNILDVAGRFLL